MNLHVASVTMVFNAAPSPHNPCSITCMHLFSQAKLALPPSVFGHLLKFFSDNAYFLKGVFFFASSLALASSVRPTVPKTAVLKKSLLELALC